MSMNKNLVGAILLPITVASVALLRANAAEDKDSNISLTEKEQAVLDRALKGRSAGSAQNCIKRLDHKEMTIVNDDILIFKSSRNAKTIFVNKPAGGCSGLKHNGIKFRRIGSSLCSGEIAQIVDFQANLSLGSCGLGKFVPYTRDDT